VTLALALRHGWRIQRLNSRLWLVAQHGAYLDMAPTFSQALRLLAGRLATTHPTKGT